MPHNLLVFLWLLLYPIADEMTALMKRYPKGREELNSKTDDDQNDSEDDASDAEGYAAIFQLVFYFGVAYLLYKYQ